MPSVPESLMEEVAYVRDALRAKVPASSIANALHGRRLGPLQILAVFHQATHARLGDLKSFAQWWGPDGVTDVAAFDAWAAQIVLAPRQ